MNNLEKALETAYPEDCEKIRKATVELSVFSDVEVAAAWGEYSFDRGAAWLFVSDEELRSFKEWIHAD